MLVGTDGSDGVCSDGLAAADGVDAFVRLGLEADVIPVQSEHPGESRADRGEVGPEFRTLADHDDINMNEAKLAVCEQLACVFDELQARGAFPFRIAVREVRADIP